MIKTTSEYQSAYQQALTSPEKYWEEKAKKFKWHKTWDSIQQGSFQKGNIKWFDGAKLNITENIFEKEEADLNKTALLWEPNDPNDKSIELTYGELFEKVQQTANAYKSLGIKKGDVIALYMPMIPETVFAALACARIGAVHSIVFGGFSAEALRSRLIDSQTKLLVTANVSLRGEKQISLLDVVKPAIKGLEHLKHTLVVKNDVTPVPGSFIDFHQITREQSPVCPAEHVSAEDPFFILYTSGSTGKPKGLLHTAAGYMVWASETFKQVFQYDKKSDAQDIFWCTADVGWITGHSYFLYGPMLNQATQVMFEGVPTFPSPARFWQVIEKYNVTHFYTAPTAIRALEACGLEHVENIKMPSLKVLGTVGEPINQEAWDWYYKNVGKENCEIVDTWWQTETGGIMISNLAGVTPSKPTYATTPLPGVEPILLDEHGKKITANNVEGVLCIKQPWPGIARTILGNHNRYMETYFTSFTGYYFTGDGARRDDNGNYRIIGRIDDVINVSGHRVSTAEVENFINEHKSVIESAVVGADHPIKGQALWAFAICSSKAEQSLLQNEINEFLTVKIGSFSKLEKFFVVDELPKTRSGKIMRRVLRKISSNNEDYGDLSTLLNPAVVEHIKRVLKDG